MAKETAVTEMVVLEVFSGPAVERGSPVQGMHLHEVQRTLQSILPLAPVSELSLSNYRGFTKDHCDASLVLIFA